MLRPRYAVFSSRTYHGRLSRGNVKVARIQQRRRLSLINTIDAVIPRSRFASSIYTTPILLILRLFYGATSFEHIKAQSNTPTETKHQSENHDLLNHSLESNKQIYKSSPVTSTWLPKTSSYPPPQVSSSSIVPHLSTSTSISIPNHPTTPPLLLHPSKTPLSTFQKAIPTSISSTYTLQSLTWIKSLDSNLSHEYIQFIVLDPVTSITYRLQIDRQDDNDYIYSLPQHHPNNTSGVDPNHNLPLPLLTLTFPDHPPSSSSAPVPVRTPTLSTILSHALDLSTSNPSYNLHRHTCWWYSESIFTHLLTLYPPHSHSTVIKEWKFAHLRYSFVIRGSGPLGLAIKRKRLCGEAEKFAELCRKGMDY